MMKMMNNLDLFTWCSLIRARRVKLGYRKADEFSDYLYSLTQVKIPTQTLLKIERGDQMPTVDKFFAINLVCFNSAMPPKEIMTCCFCDKWKELLNDNEHHVDARKEEQND